MASKPGPLTRWPWHGLGNYKVRGGQGERRGRGPAQPLRAVPTMLLRLLHTQLWISVSRHQTASSKHRIVGKSIDFDQVDRERNWDDQIILTALLFYVLNSVLPMRQGLPWWNSGGLVLTVLLHLGPVEFLYYWFHFHRALHHHYLYSRYHSHHHASVVSEPVTSVTHPFAEEAVYFVLFAIPLLSMMATGTGSVAMENAYLLYIDFMNCLGHCNFELVPERLFHLFPPLKFLVYTPSCNDDVPLKVAIPIRNALLNPRYSTNTHQSFRTTPNVITSCKQHIKRILESN
uniref:aldehyde oxygenase (deformylating) n=1 Tax=Aegilops tauschii TaxID=37682 RepID=M8BM92_AEGTA